MNFPVNLLRVEKARLYGVRGSYSVDINIAPFFLECCQEECFDQPIIINGLPIDEEKLEEMAGRCYQFPKSDERSHLVDASVYVQHAHHPVDVNSVSFGNIQNGRMSIEIDLTFIFSFEGLCDYGDVGVALRFEIPVS